MNTVYESSMHFIKYTKYISHYKCVVYFTYLPVSLYLHKQNIEHSTVKKSLASINRHPYIYIYIKFRPFQ